MRNASILRCLSICLFFLAAAVAAQVPSSINYQGLLMNNLGSYPDTTVFLTFSIYDAPFDGNVIWSESQLGIVIEDGLFEVRLGSNTPLSASVFSDVNRWLGITVGTSPEISPRIQLVTVPYAFKVSTIDGASAGTINGEVLITDKITVGEGSVNAGKSSIAIGEGQSAQADYSAVIGGQYNEATGDFACIFGGAGHQALGEYSFIAGGLSNIASGFGSFVAGGNSNYAIGDYSFAAGNQARANHEGSIVLSANACPT